MNAEERRKQILNILKQQTTPLTGTKLSHKFNVSRQIIVGDITILRASGYDIYATPRGYILPPEEKQNNLLATIYCRHDDADLQKELEIIVDNGGKIHDVIVEHPVYGEIRVNLFISTRREINQFLQKLHQTKAPPLMIMGGGAHYHTIEVPDEETLAIIRDELRKAHILIE